LAEKYAEMTLARANIGRNGSQMLNQTLWYSSHLLKTSALKQDFECVHHDQFLSPADASLRTMTTVTAEVLMKIQFQLASQPSSSVLQYSQR